jgi:hypothetical protein
MNSSSLEIEIDDETAAEVEQLSRFKISEIRASDIKVTLDETGRREVMTSLEEAKSNRFDLSPSPTELAQELAEGANLKPVRVRLASDTSSAEKYVLTEGRVRYWAYVIHNGPDCYVPALVRL